MASDPRSREQVPVERIGPAHAVVRPAAMVRFPPVASASIFVVSPTDNEKSPALSDAPPVESEMLPVVVCGEYRVCTVISPVPFGLSVVPIWILPLVTAVEYPVDITKAPPVPMSWP